MRTAALWVLLLGIATVHPAAAVNYVHDEVLWTKQRWNECMLDFPYAKFKSRDSELTRMAPELEEFAGHTLNGPLGNIDALVADDLKRGPRLHQTTFEVSLLDDQASQEAAAGVAQCKACLALATLLWEGLVDWVNRNQKLPTKAWIRQYASELCEYEVINEVLREWVILRARVELGRGAPFAKDGRAQEFYMLSQRSKQHATPQEISAAGLACTRVLSAHSPGAGTAAGGGAGAGKATGSGSSTGKQAQAGSEQAQAQADVVAQASSLLAKYYSRMLARLGKPVEGGAVERVDEGPAAERSCYNKHPQCEYWANVGECTANPTYMTGGSQPEKGWCRPACGSCTPPKAAKLPFGEEEAAFLRSVSSDLLAMLHSKGCVGSLACQWASGDASAALLAKASGDAASLIQQAAFISAPFSVVEDGDHGSGGTEQSGQGSADTDVEAKLGSSKAMLQRSITKPLVPRQAPYHGGEQSSMAALRSQAAKLRLQPPEKFNTEAGRLLWQHLGNQCFYVTTGWWSYEVCPWQHANQFHMAAHKNNEIDWVISLGEYHHSKQSAFSWRPQTTTAAELYPPGVPVPYVSQLFTDGNMCELEEAAAEGGGPAAQSAGAAAAAAAAGGEQGAGGDSGSSAAGGGAEAANAAKGSQPAAEEQGDRAVVLRQSELRIMCSPDLDAHVVVKETQQCVYVVELYVPQLCALEEFQVEEDVAGGSSGGDGGSSLSGRSGEEDEEAGAGAAELVGQEAELFGEEENPEVLASYDSDEEEGGSEDAAAGTSGHDEL